MRLQVCRMVYEDVEGIGPEDVVSWKEAERMLGMKMWNVSQLVDEGKLTMLIDADAPKGCTTEALAAARRSKVRHGRQPVLGDVTGWQRGKVGNSWRAARCRVDRSTQLRPT
jgi:hypothetical protein